MSYEKILEEEYEKKINEFDGDIIVTLDTHHENYMDTLEGQKLPVKHCIKNEWGWAINTNIMEALDKKRHVQFIEKPTFVRMRLGPFRRPHRDPLVRNHCTVVSQNAL